LQGAMAYNAGSRRWLSSSFLRLAASWVGLLAPLAWLPGVVAHTHVTASDLLPYLSDSPPTVQVATELCNVFRVVEKPYYILFGSCWICAVMQQVIDTTRYYEERLEELGLFQKVYVGIQLGTLVLETLTLFSKVNWLSGASIWMMYNLYVYVFVHSSIFVRSIMMSMIIWDWLLAKLLKRPVFGTEWDGKGWSDWERALMLIVILQFGSSAFVMAVIMVTHVLPALVLYYPVFLGAAAFVVKVRQWLKFVGVDPDGRLGRGLVMASNSFVVVAAFQTLITSIIRVYAGALSQHSYFEPIVDDISSRRIQTWYECHLSQGLGAFKDQDFLNLFIR